jgi:MFS family permease
MPDVKQMPKRLSQRRDGSPPASTPVEEVRLRKPVLLMVLLTLLFMYQADATIVNVALPSIRAGMGASGAQLELVIAGYLLASAMLLTTSARLGHMLGYRTMFLAGVGVFGAASLVCGLAGDATVLIGARVIQGVGGALAFPQVLTAIQAYFDQGAERTRALGSYSIALAGGAVVGQILGGVLVSADVLGLGWRPIFLINVPIAAAVVLAGLRWLPRGRPTGRSQRLDFPGAASLASAVLLIILPLTLGRESGWPAWTWISLAMSVPLLVLFVAIERRQTTRGRAPLVNLHVIARPAIAWGLWPQALAVATYYALLFTLALYSQRGLGQSALVSGLSLLPWVIAFAIPGRVLRRAPAHIRPLLPTIGCLTLAAAYAAISANMLAGERSEALLLVLLALGGLGLGTVFSSILVHLTTAATPRYAADISGVFTTTLQIAGTIGVAAFGTLYLSQATDTSAHTASHAFGVVTMAFTLLALLAAATAYRATHTTS